MSDTNNIDDLDCDDLGAMFEGLVYAIVPIKVAAKGVTEQYDLGPRGSTILRLIAAGTCLPMDLASTLQTSRALITIELKRLTEAGLIQSRTVKTDRRRSELSLTKAGTIACEHIRREMARIVKRNLKDYSVDELKLMTKMLRDVRRIEPEDGSPVTGKRAQKT